MQWQLLVLAAVGFSSLVLDAVAVVGTGCSKIQFGGVGCSGSGWYWLQ